MNRHLAQLNVGRLARPLDDPAMAEFVAALGPINEIAEATPGFWFQPISEAFTVCWWIESGTVPDLGDGYQRLLHLREHGPTERGWPLNTPVD